MTHNGIKNTGNECFRNSALQCLSSSPFVREFFERYKKDDADINDLIKKFQLGKYKADSIKDRCFQILNEEIGNLTQDEIRLLKNIYKYSNDIFIYISFKEIIRQLRTNKSQTINTDRFLSINKELTTDITFQHLFNGDQHDPHEFITYILDKLHNSKKAEVKISLPANIDELDTYTKLYHINFKARYETDYSYFVKNLYYYILNCVECSKCKNKTFELCPNESLCIPIPEIDPENLNYTTIEKCLDEMFKVESIEYKCEVCSNNENNHIEKKILTPPKALIIKIKRYKQVSTFLGTSLIKNSKMVIYPEQINISQYIVGENENTYELYGIINHTGSLNMGHYYSFIRELQDNGKFSNQWICCNDSRVNNITNEEAMNSQNAYMLFYNLI